ncbi:hypothetical protein QTO92_25355 [Klebsiella michiganensis]|uniref:hypothetical protein n=1 Tax=Klebsiella michiganensis TaxID=1134687 RepID=UPI00259752E9|nr:hypothetical protein [Klebsiella michiganensis]MDM4113630.1 hypothetical protein [Klebsiella michiganensis]MDM4347298.1 hypothetical protein [Klebsiella michiganensis]MDM4353187.1 hypothetical protein [Klebsiella michiganensis]
MTDITELALKEKFEAWARSQQLSIAYGDCGYVFSSTEMAWRAWKAASAELVEALEKAQQERENWRTSFDNERFRADKLKAHIDEMTEERTASINELSRIIQKEVKAKREAKKRIAELEEAEQKLCAANVTLDARAELAERRLAELESRTVTVKLPQAVSAGGQGYQEQVERILTAAGIKWEAE